MRALSREQVEKLRKTYPIGSVVELILMDDVQAPPIGTKGRVRGVEVLMIWVQSWFLGKQEAG